MDSECGDHQNASDLKVIKTTHPYQLLKNLWPSFSIAVSDQRFIEISLFLTFSPRHLQHINIWSCYFFTERKCWGTFPYLMEAQTTRRTTCWCQGNIKDAMRAAGAFHGSLGACLRNGIKSNSKKQCDLASLCTKTMYLLLMDKIQLTSWYGVWMQMVVCPMIYRVSYVSGGAGFLPSTVAHLVFEPTSHQTCWEPHDFKLSRSHHKNSLRCISAFLWMVSWIMKDMGWIPPKKITS